MTEPLRVHRVMGAETEYGIHAPKRPDIPATTLSTIVVHGYSQIMGGNHAAWDYRDETPLMDIRGWEIDREDAHESQLTDESPDFIVNALLGNGARLYVDHAHPEYSSPEVTTPREALRWDFAGETVMRRILAELEQDANTPSTRLYKNNTDGKGAAYGSHENYLVPRETRFGALVEGLTPFFISRQLICGAGRLGRGQYSEASGFQLSQRADFFEAEVGLETTIRRPIINTRDEPHAVAEKYRRLHVIIGDANLAQVPQLLKFGTTSLVLGLIERGIAPQVELAEPVATLHSISHDLSLSQRYRLRDGRRLSGIEIQQMYLEAAKQAAGEHADSDTTQVLELWEEVLTGLSQIAAGGGVEVNGPGPVARLVEWAAKWQLLEQYRQNHQLTWEDSKLAMIDLQWSDIRQEQGLANRLSASGALATVLPQEKIDAAASSPPQTTRAYFRGECIKHYAEQVAVASWDSVVLKTPRGESLYRVNTREPEDYSAQEWAEAFTRPQEYADFFAKVREHH